MSERRDEMPSVWGHVSGILRYLEKTTERADIRAHRESVEWVIKNPDLLETVIAAQKAGVPVAQTLEEALEGRATHAALLAQQAHTLKRDQEERLAAAGGQQA